MVAVLKALALVASLAAKAFPAVLALLLGRRDAQYRAESRKSEILARQRDAAGGRPVSRAGILERMRRGGL